MSPGSSRWSGAPGWTIRNRWSTSPRGWNASTRGADECSARAMAGSRLPLSRVRPRSAVSVRLLLVSPAMTRSLRRGVFDDGDPLDEQGAAQAKSAAGALPGDARAVHSPSVRCARTATALGLRAEHGGGAPAGLDAGRWQGRTLDEVAATEPELLSRWLTDPESAAPGGESVSGVCARVGGWLDGVAEGGTGRWVAVVEAEVVRAAAVLATGAPLTSFWRFDVPPLTVTELSGRDGRWNLRLGRPLV
ncbi:histidine phosphatase family protein [Streptomyces sp. NPDC058045]|uniref:histidine phosphatase family protein n=1 Tax=Streptomyces sp. NPDC058045 TaxID=3346311 RepID=UPI0036F11679